MKGDFSQWTFDRKDNFAGILHQQGRVLLDSDWNAQTHILNHWQDTAGQDVIGTGIAAVPAETPDAFKVTQAEVVIVAEKERVKLTLFPGHIWADGLLVYLDEDKDANGKPIVDVDGKPIANRIATYLQPPIQDPPTTPITDKVRDAVILEVWREAINGFQLPNTLIEPALGGPDTTERVHTAMALRLYRLAAGETCDNIRTKLRDDFNKKGKLTVSLQPTSVTDGDCPVIKGGGYTGFEHYLYRIEIAQVTSGTPMFKWSQFNGGLVGRGEFYPASGSNPANVKITANFQPIITSGLGEFYLEAIEYDINLGHWQVVYGAKATLNDANELVLGDTMFGELPATPPPPPDEPPKTTFFRLWNGIEEIGLFPVGTPKELRDGIRLEFEASSSGKYVPGDYWTFPVRAGEVGNSEILIKEQPPQGIHYHRVPLAELNWNNAKKIAFNAGQIEDCRKPFRSLTNQKGCCSFLVGDGIRTQGDFNSIKEALSHLPPSGGKICLLPGEHRANVVIQNQRDIQISGCGVHTIVHPHPDRATEPIFRIEASQNIQLDHMTLMTITGTAIQVVDSDSIELEDIPQESILLDSQGIYIFWNQIVAGIHAIEIRVRNETRAGKNDIWIAYNQISLLDKPEGKAAIFCVADDVLIERNRIVVVPPPNPDDPNDPRRPDDPGVEVFDPCKDVKSYYADSFQIYQFLQTISLYFAKAFVIKQPVYIAQGGIQIGSSSDGVKIINNEIIGGRGNGITFGHLPSDVFDDSTPIEEQFFIAELATNRLEQLQEKFVSSLYSIAIEENLIRNMGLSGIGVVTFTHLETIGLMVHTDDLTIYRNTITNCAQQIPDRIPPTLISQVGFGGIALASCDRAIIQENRIEDNGVSYIEAICGIFIFFGDKIEITNNYILNNGKLIQQARQQAKLGIRGGIFIYLSIVSKATEFIREVSETLTTDLPYDDGIPAVKVHGNVVTQPLGQALFVVAVGPVSVVDNQFTSQNVDFQADPLTFIAGAVFIFNLGFSIQEILGLWYFSAQNLTFSSFNQAQAVSYSNTAVSIQPNALQNLAYGLFWPSGRVLFNDNQTTLDLRASEFDITLSSQFIFSLDDIGFSSNQSDCNLLVDFILTNTWIIGFSVRTNDNRFREGLIAFLSLLSFGVLNTNTCNQGSHCFLALASSSQLRVDTDNLVLFPQLCSTLVERLTSRYK